MKVSPLTILMFISLFFFTACEGLLKSKKNDVKRPGTENPTGNNGNAGPNGDTAGNSGNNGSDNKSSDSGSDSNSQIASSSETKMLDEINLLRSNPKGYIQYVEEYLRYFEREGYPSLGSEKRTAQELITQLQSMTRLTELKFHEGLYKVAKDHGQFLKKRGNIFSESPHKGKNGSTMESRIQGGTDLKIFGENFGSAHVKPRYQLISLLVDAGIPGRGHRVNILDPRWNVAAFYNIGTIGIDPGCWLQLFGYEEGGGGVAGDNGDKAEPKATLSEVKKLIDRATYMTVDERKMLTEINLLRSNPRGYVKYIETYKDQVRNGEVLPFVPVDEEIEIADGLIAELRKMEPLTLLKPDLKLYNVALAHGSYLKRKGSPDLNPNPHAGRNGKGAHERIVEGANMSKGGENYQGSYVPIRETVIGLLVDSGIPGYGHRKAILNPAWDHGVCHNFGPVSSSTGISIPHNWLQNFGKR